MSQPNEAFGIMDEGYFVSRSQILAWLNTLLQLNLTKIQELGSGAVYCQIIDVVYPGKVPMNKVNWKARNDYQFIQNLKILQNSFKKIGIKKHIEVQKLAKAKYQDNLQFVQWLKRYFDVNGGQRSNGYQAKQRRGSQNIDFGFAEKNVFPKTFNASGLIQTPAKGQEGMKRIKSPMAKNSPFGKNPTNNSALLSPRNSVTANTKREKKQEKSSLMKEQVLVELQKKLEESEQEAKGYQEKAKKLQINISMVKQILGSEDDAAIKINLISEILKD